MRLIVGVDPGKYVGIAALNFRGKVEFVTTLLHPSFDVVVRSIIEKGRPVIVATDVNPPPEMVKRVASQTGSILFTPKEDIRRAEKERIMRDVFSLSLNDHERDALASAYTAYQHYKPVIERVMKRFEDESFREEIIERVIRGNQLVGSILEEFPPSRKSSSTRQRARDPKEVIRLRQRITELLEERDRLLKEIDRLRKREPIVISADTRVRQLEEKILKLRREKEMLVEYVEHLHRLVEDLTKREEQHPPSIDEMIREYRELRKQQLKLL